MKYVDARDLPPCSFSPQCLRLLDDLDTSGVVLSHTRLTYIEDLLQERQLRQLRSHALNCPTCSILLAEARHERTQQRRLLYHFLVANEQQVPSTALAIFEMVRQKAADEEKANQHVRVHSQPLALFAPSNELPDPSTSSTPLLRSRPFQQRSLLQHFVTLATVAAVILAAVGLLNHVSNQPGTRSVSHPSPKTHQPQEQGNSRANSYGWDSVAIGLTFLSAAGMVKSFTFYNYNTANGQMLQMMSSNILADFHLESVSPDGQSLLYEMTAPNQQRMYATYSRSTGIHTVYQLEKSTGGNAIWMDTNHILVQDTNGAVIELNIHSNIHQGVWYLHATQLIFYRQPFLYFTRTEDVVTSTLYRADLTQAHPEPQRIISTTSGTRFWLSLDGTTIFYARKGLAGVGGIYAVGSNGKNFRLLHTGPGLPIGYAENNALILLQQAKDKLEVIQLGATHTQPARVLFSDAAPGAVSLCGPEKGSTTIELCDQNIALEPYGHGLVLHVYYANGSHNLIYDNLVTNTTHTILDLTANTDVQLPGWSRMSAVPTAFAGETMSLCA